MRKNNVDELQYFQIITINGFEDVINTEPEPKIPVKEKSTNKDYKTYHYKGAVKRFDDIVMKCFEATTVAVSEAKAKQNILYRAKLALNLPAAAGGIRLLENLELVQH